jgi:hypothetical protein
MRTTRIAYDPANAHQVAHLLAGLAETTVVTAQRYLAGDTTHQPRVRAKLEQAAKALRLRGA